MVKENANIKTKINLKACNITIIRKKKFATTAITAC